MKRRDNLKPGSLTAVLTAELAMSVYIDKEAERLQYKLDNWPGTQAHWDIEAKMQLENHAILAEANRLLELPIPEFELK
jgi:hypothetical protein